MEFLEEFKDPSAKYRIKPFWFWNGEMRKEEIKNQIEEMAEKGLGGMFICARQGMTLPYLSKAWFEMVEYACDLAGQCGLEAWLYDEYPYPSGMSGGEVLLEHPEAEHMVLHHKAFHTEGLVQIEADLGWSRVLYAKAIPVQEDGCGDWDHSIDLKDSVGNLQTEKIYQQTGLTKYNNKRFFSYGPKKILKTILPEGNWRVELYTEGAMGDFKYYGGFFDPCNADAVQTFIETTHERYRKAIGEHFGVSVHGMFSDEVGLLSPIPWSKLLPKAFMERNGYDLLECLPALHDNSIEHAAKIRYDLYETAHELFRESYHGQVSDWCRKNHLSYATEVPSMRLGTQRYSDIIGGDTAHEKLGKSLEWIYDEYISNYRSNAKAVSSLARQMNRQYAMIESFHSVGWTMTLQDAKWMIDRLGSSGINLYNFHAFYYTIQDITKHDAPPSQFLQNPYWKHYRKLADYVGRMGAMITNTEADISIAILDPTSAFFTKLGNPFHGFSYSGESETEKAECDRMRKDWVHICKTLLFAQLDYDHLDAEILEEAIVENGKICIGKAGYSVIILAPCSCMESGARRKLEEFTAQGGCVIGLGDFPYEIIDEDCNPKENWKKLFEKETAHFLPCEGSVRDAGLEEKLVKLCQCYGQIPASIEILSGQKKEMISSIRYDKEGNLYIFLVNQGAGNIKAKVTLRDTYQLAQVCSLEDGTQWEIPMDCNGFMVELGGFESQWICTSKNSKAVKAVSIEKSVLSIPFMGKKKVSIQGKNIGRFAFAKLSLDKEHWAITEVKTFIEQCADLKILEKENITFSGEFGTPKKMKPNYPMNCWYKVEFVADLIPADLSLLMDRETIAGNSRIFVNGIPVKSEDRHSVFVNDHNNQAIPIQNLVHIGTNEILIEVLIEKDEDGLRDPFYLWGTFGVEITTGSMKLTKQPEEAELNHTWIKGFPYYSGVFTFRTEYEVGDLEVLSENISLELGLEAPIYDCLELILNGHNLGVKAYTPYSWNCKKEFLKTGVNQVEVKLTNTLANMLDGVYFDYEKHQLVNIEG